MCDVGCDKLLLSLTKGTGTGSGSAAAVRAAGVGDLARRGGGVDEDIDGEDREEVVVDDDWVRGACGG